MRLSSQDQSMKLQQVDKNLAEFTLTMIQPAAAAASGNSGALTTLDVKLETLHFFCNRPTVCRYNSCTFKNESVHVAIMH